MSFRLTPLDREGPHADVPLVDQPARGLVLYWPGERIKVRRKRGAPAPLRLWNVQAFIFSALRADHDDMPPRTAEEERYMVVQAYALAASHHPIPSDAEVLYEVKT